MSSYGFILDIVGENVALTSHPRLSSSVSQWSAAVQCVIAKNPLPNEMSVSFDPKTGKSSTSGLTLRVTHSEFLMTQRKTSPITRLSSAVSQGSTSAISVGDTTDFESEGWIWIGNEAIQYTGKSATQLGTTSINARGALGTDDVAHESDSIVYGFNPEVINRKCELYRVNLGDTSDKTKVFTGYIKGFGQRGETIKIASLASELLKEKVVGSAFSRGTIALDLRKSISTVRVSLSNKDDQFVTPQSGVPLFAKVGDEVLSYTNVLYPFTEAELTGTPSNNYQVDVYTNHFFQVGDVFDFTDSSNNLVDGGEGQQITKIERVTDDVVTHTGQILSPLASGYKMRHNYKMLLLNCVRGLFGTTEEEHGEGTEVQEVRVLEGSSLDILFWLLFSDEGDQTNGPNGGVWDILPTGWGIGLTADDVDYEAFEAIRHRCSYRRYVLDAAQSLGDWLSVFAVMVNAAIYVTPAGKLTCKPFKDIFPGELADHTLTISNAQQILGFNLDDTTVANYAIIRGNYDFDGAFHFQTIVTEGDSIARHGARNLFDNIFDKGISSVGGISAIVAQVEAHLVFRAKPLAIISAQILYVFGSVPRPGDSVRLTFPNLPNLQGLTGYTGSLFYVLDSRPNVQAGTVELQLIERPETTELARVAPSAIVDSVSTLDVTLKAASTSHFSESSPQMTPASGETGDEDVDWFQVDDVLTFWDSSTLSNVTPTTANAVVTAVDYATRTLTVDAVPGWLADGDLVRARTWSNWTGTANELDWQEVFLAFADDSDPPLIGTDNAYKWGNG